LRSIIDSQKVLSIEITTATKCLSLTVFEVFAKACLLMLSVCQLRFELRTNESASIGTARGGIKWVSPMFASTVEAKAVPRKVLRKL
jgi:hypothetical protein